jgi:hypothetical protein
MDWSPNLLNWSPNPLVMTRLVTKATRPGRVYAIPKNNYKGNNYVIINPIPLV